MNTKLLLLLILAAIISPASAISITASQGTGGETYTSSTAFKLDPSASLSGRISDGMTSISVMRRDYYDVDNDGAVGESQEGKESC